MTQQKLSKNDLPGLAVLFSVILFFLSATLIYGWKLDFEEKNSLIKIAGVVSGFEQTNKSKAGRKMHIYLSSNGGRYHLTQDDLTYSFPALRTISKGDRITALVAEDCCGRDLEWVWEINRDGETILSYEDTLNSMKDSAMRSGPIGKYVSYLACLLLVAGLGLRIKYGVWSS